MQKKVLLPILVAGPVAIPALADIDYKFPNPSDWNRTGIFNDTFVQEDGSISAGVGSGTLTSGELTYPKGSYKLVFSTATNITVKIGGVEIEAEDEDGLVYPFECDGEPFVIEISSADSSKSLSFTGSKLTLVFDVDQAIKANSNAFTAVASLCTTIPEVAAEDTGDYFKQGDELREERAKYFAPTAAEAKELEAVNTIEFPDGEKITAQDLYKLLNGNRNNNEQLLEIYSKYGFNQTPYYVETYFQKLIDETIKPLIESIETENEKFANYQANVENKTALEEKHKTLTEKVAAMRTQLNSIQGVDAEVIAKMEAEVDAASAEVESWWKKVEDTYKMPILDNEDTWRDSVLEVEDLNTEFGTLSENLDELAETIGNSNADWQIYYEVNFNLIPELKSAFDSLTEYLSDIRGVVDEENNTYDYSDNFAKYVEGVLKEATETYDDAKGKTIPNVEGAVAYNEENGCKDSIEKAIKALEEALEAAKVLVDGQNENMTTALETVAEDQAALDEIVDDTTVPNSFKDKWQELVDAAQDAINELKAYDEEHYGDPNYDLSVEDNAEYTALTDAVDEALKALGDFAEENNFDDLNDLQKKLDDAWKKIEEADKDGFVRGRMENTKDNLQDAIESLDPTSSTFDEDKEAIGDQIESMATAAENLAKAVKELDEVFSSIGDAFIDFDKEVTEKIIEQHESDVHATVDFENLKKYKDEYKADESKNYQKALALHADYLNQYNTIKTEVEGQQCLDQLTALLETMKETTVESLIEAAQMEFEKGGTNINYSNAEDLLGEYFKALSSIDEVDNDSYPGYEDVVTKKAEIQSSLDDIEAAIESAASVADYQEQDKEIDKLLDAIVEFDNQVQSVLNNRSAYNQMTASLATIDSWLEKLKEYNENYTDKPAKSFFEDEIKKLEEAKEALDEKVKDAFDEGKAYTDQKDLEEEISNLDETVLNTYKWDKGNNETHSAQVNTGIEVGQYINGIISEIDGLLEGMEDTAVSELLNDWKEELEGYLKSSTEPENLNEVNSEVYDSYGKGKSVEDDEDINAKYDALKAAAKAIKDQLDGDTYHDAVTGVNDSTTSGWDQGISDLDNDYRDGIREFNFFFYNPGLTNEGWRNYVEEKGTQKTHAVLYTYYDEINKFSQEIQAWIAEQNAANHVITKAEWKEKYTDRFDELAEKIANEVSALISDMNEMARDYYALLNGEVDKSIEDAEEILGKQGIPVSPYMDTIKSDDEDAHKAYDKATAQPETADAQEQIGGMMDSIANTLDGCLPPYDYQTWASDQWKAEKKAADDKISDLREEINDADFADNRNDLMEKFEEIVEKINDLDKEVKGIDENLIDVFGEYSDKLDEYLEELEGIKDEIKKNSDNNVAEKKIYDDFQAELPKLNEALENLDAYAKSLAGAASKSIGDDIHVTIKDAIESLNNDVEKNKGNLGSQNPSIEDRVNAIYNSIEREYTKVATAESSYLMKTLYGKMVKEAFNNAYDFVMSAEETPESPEDTTWAEYFKSVDEKINSYDELLGDAGTWGGEFAQATDQDARNDWRDGSVKLEKELCDIYAELQKIWSSDPAEDVVSGLDALAADVQGKIDAAREALAGCSSIEDKSEFEARYDEAQAALDAEQALWADSAEGSWVVAREAFHKAVLEMMGAEIADVEGDVEEAEDLAAEEAAKKAASDEKAASLQEEYDALEAEFEKVKEEVAGYSESVQEKYADDLDNIQDMLDAAKEALDAAKEEGSLTEDSTLENSDKIKEAIEKAHNDAAADYTKELLEEAKGARSEASDKLKNHLVPSVYEELKAEWDELNDELNEMLDAVKEGADFDSLAEMMERIPGMIEEFNSIAERAKEGAYLVGDVNGDGEVDVVDVQKLIRMIGEDTKYEDLEPSVALAADVAANGELNIADVTTLVAMILNSEDEHAADKANSMRVRANSYHEAGDDTIVVELVSEENGVRRYAINLTNATTFLAGQMDIEVSGNASLKVVSDADRTSGHDVMSFDNSTSTRVMIVSLSNEEIAGNNGAVAYIEVEGRGDLLIKNVIFSDTENRAHKLGTAPGTTGVNSLMDTLNEYGEKIYDAAGRMYNKIQRGINIIRHKDGSVTKEIRK